MMKTVDLLYVTYNRLYYTKRTLLELFKNAAYDFSLTIVDNGSTDGTVEYLKKLEREDFTGVKIIYNKNNEGLSKPTNQFWENSTADYVGKVDNDVILPYGWLNRLITAYEQAKTQNIKFGALGACHSLIKFLDRHLKDSTIEQTEILNGYFFRQFIGGCCYIIDRQLIVKNGKLKHEDTKIAGWTEYQHRLMRMGYPSAYVWPLMMVDHMGDENSWFFDKSPENQKHLEAVLKERNKS